MPSAKHITVESKYLLVDSFIKYRIVDVLTFYKANNGSFNSLNSLLGQRSEFVLKNNFGKRTVQEVVSGERDELMSIMLSSLNDSVVDLGVEIVSPSVYPTWMLIAPASVADK